MVKDKLARGKLWPNAIPVPEGRSRERQTKVTSDSNGISLMFHVLPLKFM